MSAVTDLQVRLHQQGADIQVKAPRLLPQVPPGVPLKVSELMHPDLVHRFSSFGEDHA